MHPLTKHSFPGRGRSVPLVLVALAIAVAACGSSSGSARPSAPGPSAPGASSGNPSPPAGGWTLSGAGDRLAGLDSYKFKMTVLSSDITSAFALLTGASTTDAPIALTGTIVNKPEAAADITIGSAHVIDVAGTEYLDESGSGVFDSSPSGSASVADSWTPAAMFGLTVDPTTEGGFAKVGANEQKNGVPADHYQATADALAQYGEMTGVSGATWSADIWIATGDGYPVSVAVIGKSGGKVVYEVAFDISNVGDPTNKVSAPNA